MRIKTDPDGIRKKLMNVKPELELRRLKVIEKYEHGQIDLSNIDLRSLEGCPNPKLSPIVQERLDKTGVLTSGPAILIFKNRNLSSWKGIPNMTYRIDADECAFTSLEGCPQVMHDSLEVQGNKITNLKGIGKNYLRHCYGRIELQNNPVESHVLGLMNVIGLMRVEFIPTSLDDHPLTIPLIQLTKIANDHLRGSKDFLDFQEDLISAGLKDYAKM